jgi:hypothetical protein
MLITAEDAELLDRIEGLYSPLCVLGNKCSSPSQGGLCSKPGLRVIAIHPVSHFWLYCGQSLTVPECHFANYFGHKCLIPLLRCASSNHKTRRLFELLRISRAQVGIGHSQTAFGHLSPRSGGA